MSNERCAVMRAASARAVPRKLVSYSVAMSRTPLRMIVAVAGLIVVAGCTGSELSEPESSPSNDASDTPVPESDPVDLVGLWRVIEAEGEDDPAWLRLGADGLHLWRDCGMLSGSWRADGSRFLGDMFMGSEGCEPWENTWLDEVVSYRPTEGGPGWELLDAGGSPVAVLVEDGAPEPAPDHVDSLVEPPEVSDATREALRLPTRPTDLEGSLDVGDLVGRWIPAETYQTDPFVEFSADGSWRSSDGCNETAARWVAGSGGEFLATTGVTSLIGCEGVSVMTWLGDAAWVDIDDGSLSLYDRDGDHIGDLVRDGA